MKRKAEEDGLLAAPTSKKPAIDLEDYPNADTASVDSYSPSSVDHDNDHDNDDDDDGSTLHPTTGTHTAPATTITTTSRTSRKFPSDLKTIKCTFPGCDKTFNRPARLAAHIRSHTNDRAFRCTFPGCGKDYLEEKHLAQHIKGSHTHEKKYPCPDPGCGKSFVTATRLRRHAAVHKGADRFRCRGYEGCDQTFRKHQTLQRHVRVVHLEQAAYVCTHDGCTEGFDSHGALRRHVEREHGALRFWCDMCNNKSSSDPQEEEQQPLVGFTTLHLLQSHMRRDHMACMFCDLPCGTQADVERHIDTHHATAAQPRPVQDRKNVVCPYPNCPKAFTRVSNLNTHIKTAHEGVRFVCGQVDTFSVPDIADWNWTEEGCGQAFISKVKLEDHVRFVHLGRPRPARLYTVPTTTATTGAAAVMAEMEEPTNRDIPCAVGDCPAMFIRHADRERHVQRYHNPEAEAGVEDAAIDPQLLGGGEQQPAAAPVWLLDPEAEGGASQTGLGADNEWAPLMRLLDVEAVVDTGEAIWVEG